jgi:hypothetical protein
MVQKKFLYKFLLLLSIVILPSCKWFEKSDSSCPSCPSHQDSSAAHNDGSTVLLTVNGKPALTAKEFEDFINKATEGNEQMKLYMQFVPDFKEQVFAAKKRALIIGEWAKNNNIRETKEYKDKANLIMDQIRENLDTEAFIKKNDAEVTDEQAKKYYDENKDQDPRIATSASGANAAGVSFANGNAANEFAQALQKSNGKDFDKLAKERKLNVTQFGVVNNESVIDSKIKEKISAVKSTPAVIVVKDEKGKNWVVVVKSIQKAQYRPFEQVKDVIKRILKPKMLEEMLEKEVTKFEKEFNVVANKAYFEEQKKKSEADAQQAMQAMTQQSNEPAKQDASANVNKEAVAPQSV